MARLLHICQSCMVCVKVLYDCRKTFRALALNSPVRKQNFFKYFLVSGTMVDIESFTEMLPEDCLKYIKPPPERKMILVANLKMNGSMKRLKKYSECLNKSVSCPDFEKEKKVSLRNYKTQLYPDLVDVIIAPPYPYVEAMSNWLRKDCLKCRDCNGCLDCSRCKDCVDCVDCKDCKCNNCDECCQNKCLNFCSCDPGKECDGDTSQGSEGCSVCECDNCDVCQFCQTCFKNDCAECSMCIQTAGQNSFPYLSGGMPGEVTPRQLRELGARWVIIGSSERRELFKESDELLAHKLRCALMARMQVVYCINDSCEDNSCNEIENQLLAVIPKIGVPGPANESGNPHLTKFKLAKKVIGKNTVEYLEIGGLQDWSKVAIAYEPLWAIKDGQVPTPEQAEEKCKLIRDIIKRNVNSQAANNVRILYGGPVGPDSAPDYADQPSIDGFMIGYSAFQLDDLIPIANSWFIKNRQNLEDVEEIIGTPDPCVKEPVKEEGLIEKCEPPNEPQQPICSHPKVEKIDKCQCAKDIELEKTKKVDCPKDPRCSKCAKKK